MSCRPQHGACVGRQSANQQRDREPAYHFATPPCSVPDMSTKSPDPVVLSSRLRFRAAGVVVGVLATSVPVVFLPALLRQIGMEVTPAWGLGAWAGLACLVGAIPGGIFWRPITH